MSLGHGQDDTRKRGRRQSAVLRNLDTPLKVLGVITVKSCGIVLLFFAFVTLLHIFGLWQLLLGPWGVLVPFVTVSALAFTLAYIERHEDEHLVLAAIRYFFTERVFERWWYGRLYVYTGLTQHHYRPHPMARIFE